MACGIEELWPGPIRNEGAPRLFRDLKGNSTPPKFDNQKKVELRCYADIDYRSTRCNGGRKSIRFRERKTAERRRHISPKMSQAGCVTRQEQPDRNQQKQSEKTVEAKTSSKKQFLVQEISRSTNGRDIEKRRDFVERKRTARHLLQ